MITHEELVAIVQKLESKFQKQESTLKKQDSIIQKQESMLQSLTVRMEDAETYMKELAKELTKEINKVHGGFAKLQRCIRDIGDMVDELRGETATSRSESSAARHYVSEEIDRNCEVSDSQYNSEELGSYDRGPVRQSSKHTACVPQPPPPEDSFRHERINQWVVSQERITRDDRKKAVKRPRASVNRSPKAKATREKRKSDQQDDDSDLPPARCHGCPKVSKRICEVCARYVCMDHRKMTIRCPDYLPDRKDCHQNGHPVARNPTKTNAGRCVGCVGGKNRKTSRTPCQTCGRFICKVHQQKHIRCLDHVKDSTPGRTAAKKRAPAVERSQPPSVFQESEVIDRIYP